jgi:hypothetical protein
MSWNLKLVGREDLEDGPSGRGGQGQGAPRDTATANSDIGLAVLMHKPDGTLPLLLPYK